MTREGDAKSAAQLGWALDLAALVADVRAERVESLPEDSIFALALVLLSAFDQDELAARLAVPAEVIEAAGRQLHRQVYRELTLRSLKQMGNVTKDTKGL